MRADPPPASAPGNQGDSSGGTTQKNADFDFILNAGFQLETKTRKMM